MFSTVTRTRADHTMRLTRADLVKLLRGDVFAGRSFPDVPEDARVYVEVPGGGDWSGQPLDIVDDVCVCVSWTIETTGAE